MQKVYERQQGKKSLIYKATRRGKDGSITIGLHLIDSGPSLYSQFGHHENTVCGTVVGIDFKGRLPLPETP